jgi:tRNA threonylcarbamoyladenosine biosynthesis protein TsaB
VSLLLHIDTAVDAASICISQHNKVLAEALNPNSRESAAWLQPALQQLVQDAGVSLQQVQAVSVSAGPGSYTGLRVGMATAKGLCYALGIPLIALNTLEVMAVAALPQVPAGALLCPMVDARRMEVFTAIYDRDIQPVLAPTNLIVAAESFDQWLVSNKLYFFGNGSPKIKYLFKSEGAQFIPVTTNATSLVPIAFERFERQQFADLAYAEPNYVKGFYTT